MKTQQTLLTALNKYEKELSNIRERLEWTTVWLDAANVMQEKNLFVAQVNERDDLRRRETEMDFKVRFTKWVLEDEKPKEKQDDK